MHERQWQIDFLLIALRKILDKRFDLKVVLMSATMDASLFQNFFYTTCESNNTINGGVSAFTGAPLISVPGRTFEVASYYLEDLLEATGHVIEEGSICAKANKIR